MQRLSPFLMTVLACIVILAALNFGLPDARVSAFQPAQSAAPTAIVQQACSAGRSVQVSGTAIINVTPDRVSVQLGVQSNGTTIEGVEQMNTFATQAVIKSARLLGVEAKDIATEQYYIEPIYENYDSLYIKGYRINNIVSITLRDVSKTSTVIAAALKAGANQVINIDFYTSELRKYRDQAREMAMKAAQEKAQALASAAGASADCVLSITENSWSYYNGWWYGRNQGQNQWTQNVVQNVAPSAGVSSGTGDEPISLGQISVKAEVQATFGLK